MILGRKFDVRYSFLVLLVPFFGVNLYLSSSVFIPSFYGCVLCLFFFYLFCEFRTEDLIYLLLVLLVPFLTTFLCGPDFIFGRIKGFLALVYSSVYALVFGRLIFRTGRKSLFKAVGLLLVITVMLIVLERFTPVSSVLLSFRAHLYPDGLYINDTRDLSHYGFVRPKLLFSEPSFLAIYIGCMVWTYISLSLGRLKDYFLSFLVLASAYFLVGSPTLFVFAIGLAVSMPYLYASKLISIQLLAFYSLMVAVFFILACVMFSFEFLPGIERIEDIFSGRDNSVNERILLSADLMLHVLSERPLFGVGVSGTESAFDIFDEVYQAHGMRINRGDAGWSRDIHALGANVVMSFGLLGSSILFLTMFFICKKLLPLNFCGVLFAWAFLLQFLVGAYVTPLYWLYLVMLLVGLKLRHSDSLALSDALVEPVYLDE
tara:strand:- start:1370 stop:2662 length:1293 start_codon:yes stop_codon:yes gene_type:complete